MLRSTVRLTRHYAPTSYGTPHAGSFLSQFQGGSVTRSTYGNDEAIALITFDNPGKKNVLTGSMLVQLREAIREVAGMTGKLRALILKGADGNFSSGLDHDFALKTANYSDGYLMSRFVSDTLWEMACLPLPVIAVLERNCLGGAAEIAAAADIRVANNNARMAFMHAHVGITPGFGTVRFLNDIVGRSICMELLATGELIDADRMKKLGLVNYTFDTDDQLAAYVKRFSDNNCKAVRASKMIVRDSGWEERKKSEVQMFLQLWGGKEHRESLVKK